MRSGDRKHGETRSVCERAIEARGDTRGGSQKPAGFEKHTGAVCLSVLDKNRTRQEEQQNQDGRDRGVQMRIGRVIRERNLAIGFYAGKGRSSPCAGNNTICTETRQQI